MRFLENIPLFPEQASTFAGTIDYLYWFALAISAFFSLLIAALIVVFAIKFKRKSESDYGIPETTSTPLEITWSVIPLVIMLVMFFWGVKVFVEAYRIPPDATEYWVVGKQWMWKYKHPEGNREINDLHVPVGQKIRLTMTSEDVIHSFYVPAFRVKADVLPGRYTYLWFEATKPGVYDIFCAEYCGAEHSLMGGKVHVLEPAEYEAWLAGQDPGLTLAATGEQLFDRLACVTCHKSDDDTRGPRLAELGKGEAQLLNGKWVERDANYVRESILRPGAKVVAGYQPVMPSYQGQVTEEEIIALVEYLKQVEEPPTVADSPSPDSATPGASAPGMN